MLTPASAGEAQEDVVCVSRASEEAARRAIEAEVPLADQRFVTAVKQRGRTSIEGGELEGIREALVDERLASICVYVHRRDGVVVILSLLVHGRNVVFLASCP